MPALPICACAHPLGVTHIDMPATPEKVWRAIRPVPSRIPEHPLVITARQQVDSLIFRCFLLPQGCAISVDTRRRISLFSGTANSILNN
jgi:hypothetical protein